MQLPIFSTFNYEINEYELKQRKKLESLASLKRPDSIKRLFEQSCRAEYLFIINTLHNYCVFCPSFLPVVRIQFSVPLNNIFKDFGVGGVF